MEILLRYRIGEQERALLLGGVTYFLKCCILRLRTFDNRGMVLSGERRKTMNTIFSAEERKKIVVVFSGTDNKAFLQFLTDELHARGCKVDVYRELWDALRCLQNPAVVGFIVDDYNEVEI